jgi:triosephosphate isomerase
MPKILAANWKMNFLLNDVKTHIEKSIPFFQKYNTVEILLAVPYPYLITVKNLTSHLPNVKTGTQDCSRFNPSGAYTGEVSAAMIRSCGASFTIIGHSERRKFFNESNDVLAKKLSHAFESGLDVIFCIGETLEERNKGMHLEITEKQLESVFSLVPVPEQQKIYIAYEPVWAIGTSVNASPDQILQMHEHIQLYLKKIFPDKKRIIPLLYGGSCNASNAGEIFRVNGVDGGLIGGASLHAEEFGKMLEIASHL